MQIQIPFHQFTLIAILSNVVKPVGLIEGSMTIDSIHIVTPSFVGDDDCNTSDDIKGSLGAQQMIDFEQIIWTELYVTWQAEENLSETHLTTHPEKVSAALQILEETHGPSLN